MNSKPVTGGACVILRASSRKCFHLLKIHELLGDVGSFPDAGTHRSGLQWLP